MKVNLGIQEWSKLMVQCLQKLRLMKLISNLKEFRHSLEKHIASCVTDSASVMVKFGKLIQSDHNLCYAHGINLAVCDVLYRKTKTVS